MGHSFEIKEKELLISLKRNEFMSIPKELIRAINDKMHTTKVFNEKELDHYTYHCCSCNYEVEDNFKYCRECGSKLDWSVEE